MDQWSAAIAFAPVDSRQNPNSTGGAEAYYRAMTVTFASLRRWNAAMPLRLVTDSPPPADHEDAFSGLGVEVVYAPFAHRPPEGFGRQFAASLYQLDALTACQDQPTLFVDPDVLCVRPLDRMLGAVGDRLGVLPMPYPADYDINGLTPRQAGQLHALLGEPVEVADHHGGECYAVPAGQAAGFLDRAEKAWALSLDRHAAGERPFTTEEHLLSYALRGLPTVSLDAEVRRIWTAARYRTVRGDERSLSLWHMPAEKDRGFQELYPAADDRSSWFWRTGPDQWTDRAARVLGVDHRRPARLLRDVAGRVAAMRA